MIIGKVTTLSVGHVSWDEMNRMLCMHYVGKPKDIVLSGTDQPAVPLEHPNMLILQEVKSKMKTCRYLSIEWDVDEKANLINPRIVPHKMELFKD